MKINIQQYVCAEKSVTYLEIFQMTFQYDGQREKNDELPNDTAMVHTKPRTRPNPNIHFSWSLAGVAASQVSIQSHMVSYCSAIKVCN